MCRLLPFVKNNLASIGHIVKSLKTDISGEQFGRLSHILHEMEGTGDVEKQICKDAEDEDF